MSTLRTLAGVLAGVVLLGLGSGVATAATPTSTPTSSTVTGVAVGSGNTNINWGQLKAEGVEFAYVEDTAGTMNNNPYFTQQYDGARAVGMFVGAVHFALPNASSGTTQADYLVGNGGSWAPGKGILPPVVDLEWDPYGSTGCYGLSTTGMVDWITQFTAEVHARTTRWPVIYTDAAWWTECTGNLRGFAATDPLWTTRSASGSATLPYNWTAVTFSSTPTDALHAYFNGTLAQLSTFANG
jgi:GH25 family lysozyme M1 (1,4-beta-N-acetylmuramidase)